MGGGGWLLRSGLGSRNTPQAPVLHRAHEAWAHWLRCGWFPAMYRGKGNFCNAVHKLGSKALKQEENNFYIREYPYVPACAHVCSVSFMRGIHEL